MDVTNKFIDIVFANEEEARAFTGYSDPLKAIEKISEYCEISIVKIGENGSLIKTKNNEILKIPPITVQPADTTGAGDLYASGFLYGLIKDLPLNMCGRIGSLLAGKVVEVIGAKLSESTWNEIIPEIEKITDN